MFDVLEHIADVPSTLKRVHSFLKPGGILYLKLPNGTWAQCKSLFARLFGLDSRVLSLLYIEPGGHLNYWNRDNIHELERYGFRVVGTDNVLPTKRQFRQRYPFYIGWYWITRLLHISLYPEFYVILQKTL
jgi:hypothetical protein